MKNLVIGSVAVGALALAFAAGGYVGRLEGRLESEGEIKGLYNQAQALSSSNSQLLLGIAAQNQAVAVAEAQAEGAKQVQAEAQLRAEEASRLSGSRMDKLDKALRDAKTAGDVLTSYWEIRK